jgi:DNA-binding response OmpR family regulator
MFMDNSSLILLIDDNEQLLRMLTKSLTSLAGFRVITASNGAEGLEMFFTHAPDCVVVDVVMPELNGFQFVRALRGDPETAQTPLIILTALAQDKDQFIGLASGADQFLIKPVKPTELIATIDRALQISPEERMRQYEVLLHRPIPTGEDEVNSDDQLSL